MYVIDSSHFLVLTMMSNEFYTIYTYDRLLDSLSFVWEWQRTSPWGRTQYLLSPCVDGINLCTKKQKNDVQNFTIKKHMKKTAKWSILLKSSFEKYWCVYMYGMQVINPKILVPRKIVHINEASG
jgi:hypothetical protein